MNAPERQDTRLVAARFGPPGRSGYSPVGMKGPRHAHWLVVPMLGLALGLGPVAPVYAAPEPSADAEAPEGNDATTPAGDAEAEGETKADGSPSAAEPKATGEGEPAGGEPAAAESPAGEAATAESPEGEAATAESPAGEAAKPEPAKPEPTGDPEGTIVVRPGPVTSISPDGQDVGDQPSREVVLDPRRRLSDGRIVVRAGVLAFGVAGLALAPTVVGLHQRAYARRTLERLETPSEADARPEVERYERSMTTLAIIAGAASASSFIAGAVLVGVGLRRRDAPRQTTLAPAVGGGTAGLALRGRF